MRQIFTLNETHTFGPAAVNEARIGFNRWSTRTTPNAQLNPAEFGIRNGISEPIGLPQISIAGGSLNFGGPAINPSGRGDTTFVAADTLTWLFGKHSIKLGGEYRQFLNNNFRQGHRFVQLPDRCLLPEGTANSFSVTLGNQSSSIAQGALGFFRPRQLQVATESDPRTWPALRMEYDAERTLRPFHRLRSNGETRLLRAGTDFDEIYHQNNKNFQPRLGFAWDPFNDGKTVGAWSLRDPRGSAHDERGEWREREPAAGHAADLQRTDTSGQRHQRGSGRRACSTNCRPATSTTPTCSRGI